MRRRREARLEVGREAAPHVARPEQRVARVVIEIPRVVDDAQKDRDAHDRGRGGREPLERPPHRAGHLGRRRRRRRGGGHPAGDFRAWRGRAVVPEATRRSFLRRMTKSRAGPRLIGPPHEGARVTASFPTTDTLPTSELHALGSHLGLVIVTPDDVTWDDAREAWNLAVDQNPVAVAFPESASHVAALVDFARYHGLSVAPQGTGHGAGAIESLENTLLVKTERMRAVSVDPVTRTARVGAGALWMDVTAAASEHGLAALAGSSPDVGVVGYMLGGGLSWMARRHGLAANSVTAIELVTADGRLVRTDPHMHRDLFWALRGGGGSFGVVTAIEFELYPVAEVYAGMLAFPIERASEVLHAWREWTATVPDEVTSIGRLMRIPPLPEIPEMVRGRQLAVVEATILGSEQDGASLIEPLRALGAEIGTFATIPAAALQQLHMDPDHPVPGKGVHMLLDDLPAEAVDALVETAGAGTDTPLLSIELRHLGGAVGRAEAHHGATGTIDAGFAMFGVGMAMTPEMVAGIDAYKPRLRAALAPYVAGRAFLNFEEDEADSGYLFDRFTYQRLRAVKAKYDPSDLFVSNHPIPPA